MPAPKLIRPLLDFATLPETLTLRAAKSQLGRHALGLVADPFGQPRYCFYPEQLESRQLDLTLGNFFARDYHIATADAQELFADWFAFVLQFEHALEQPHFTGVVLNDSGKPVAVLTADMLRAVLRGEAEIDVPRWATEPPKEPETGGEPAPDEPKVKSINAWIEGHDATQPLTVGQRYPLRLNVGDPRADNLVDPQAAAIAESDIPTHGLDTRWVIVSDSVDLEPESDAIEVAVKTVNGVKTWQATFDLHIPKQGESETRQLSVAPLRAEGAALAVTIFSGDGTSRQDTVFRTFTLKFDAGVAVRDDVQLRRGTQARVATPHEWQTPPARLTIFAQNDRSVLVMGQVLDAKTGVTSSISTVTEWNATQAALAGPIQNLRAVAEKFRGAAEAYLNDIDLNDLMGRLQNFKHASSPDAAHTQRWDQVQQSAELRAVAQHGRILYDTLFPLGTPLRGWIDVLAPSCRVDINTAHQSSWVPDLPWPLLYLGDPAQPIDPFAFWGLRFRTEYLAHRSGPADISLGPPHTTYRGHALYWGSGPTDATTQEASTQRKLWASGSNFIFAPGDPPPADPAAELRALFGNARPGPMPVLYLFCQTALDPVLNSPVLRFGPTNKATDVLDVATAITQPLPDKPLVFANACSTAEADPYVANALEATFFRQQCRAFLGTSIKVPIQFASRFATIFFYFFYRQADAEPMAAGEAVTQTRLFLWTHYRNLGGLLYNYINYFDLFMAEPQEIAGVQN